MQPACLNLYTLVSKTPLDYVMLLFQNRIEKNGKSILKKEILLSEVRRTGTQITTFLTVVSSKVCPIQYQYSVHYKVAGECIC